jgi:GDP-L-fucose synthase
MEKEARIYVAGHTGMVGSALCRNLYEQGFTNLVTRTISELDLLRQTDVERFFETERPEYAFIAAARVGGIHANNVYRGQFIYENLQIQNNLIHSSYLYGVKKLVFLGSSCIYPKNALQPLKEEYLLTGELEETNEPYAVAKIAGIKLCESYSRQYGCNFISVMPTNLYGPNDNYNLETSHVLPALIRKLHLAHCLETGNWEMIRADFQKRPVEGIHGIETEELISKVLAKYGIKQGFSNSGTPEVVVTLWGTGQVFREFMHVDDMAGACIRIMQNLDAETMIREGKAKITTFLNIGTGKDQTIAELASIISEITGFRGRIEFDPTRPDGTFRKLLDISNLERLNFHPAYSLHTGIQHVFSLYSSY